MCGGLKWSDGIWIADAPVGRCGAEPTLGAETDCDPCVVVVVPSDGGVTCALTLDVDEGGWPPPLDPPEHAETDAQAASSATARKAISRGRE